MSKKNTVLHILLFSKVAIIIAALLFGCKQNDLKTVQNLTAKDTIPVQRAVDAKIFYSEKAEVLVLLKSPLIERYITNDPYIEMTKGLEVLFFDSLQNVSSRLTAQYAIVYNLRRIMEARNNVVVVNKKNEQLNTEHLIWNQNTKKIYSPKFVKITSPERVIYGDGFESDEQFDKWRIVNVKGIINFETDLE